MNTWARLLKKDFHQHDAFGHQVTTGLIEYMPFKTSDRKELPE
jgi:hypothetical protein